MYFLIDLENVHNDGLKGCRFLKPDDSVEFFYSECAKKVDSYQLERIECSGCQMMFYKLKTPRKNALDFYIVSRLGELTSRNKDIEVALISNDTGFQSCVDYYQNYSEITYPVILAPNVRKAITMTKNPICKERRQEIVESPELEDLDEFQQRYCQKQYKLAEKVASVVSGTKYASYKDDICCLIDSASDSRKHIYLGALRMFGREDGLGVYHLLQNVTFDLLDVKN